MIGADEIESEHVSFRVNLHIYPAPILNASRIFRETMALAQSGLFDRVVICGTAQADLPRVEHLSHERRIERIGPPSEARSSSVLARIWEQVSWSWAVFRQYRHDDISVVNAHSVAVLPIAYLLSRRLGAKLVYDTHELETETSTASGIQRAVFKFIERSLIGRCDAIFVVNESIAEWYRANYRDVDPLAVRNMPSAKEDLKPAPIREILAIPATRRLFVHVGNLTGARNIPAILQAFASPQVEDHVVFLGDGRLSEEVLAYVGQHSNIHHLSAVAPDDVVGYLAGCDVGLCLIQPSCLSYKLSLPNKALEYTLARIPFFYTALPEVRNLLGPSFDKWQIDAGGLAPAIVALTNDQIEGARRAMAVLALPTWDEESAAMTSRYVALLPTAGVQA